MSTPAEKARRRWLVETFPKTFFEKGSERPLKIGILEDLQQYAREHPEPKLFPVEDKSIRLTLFAYLRNVAYLRRVAEAGVGAARVDLDGNDCGEVTEPQHTWTVDRVATLERRHAQKLARRAIEEERARRAAQRRAQEESTTTARRSSATS